MYHNPLFGIITNMTAITLDTLAITKKLKSSGYSQQQAEAQAEVLADLVENNLSTKADLKELEYRLTIKLGGMLVVGISVVAAIVR